MLQTNRRHDPYPLTWEIPAGTLTLLLTLAVFGVHLGRSLANWTAGNGWTWPSGRALLSSLPAVLTGHATAGLDSLPATPAAPFAVIGWIIAIETALLMAAALAIVSLLRRWGPGRMRGMATRADAETTLGLTRLRRTRSIVRPDLYPPTGRSRS